MAVKDVLAKFRKALLCCGSGERKRSLEISSPTDVQRGVLDMPGLTDEHESLLKSSWARVDAPEYGTWTISRRLSIMGVMPSPIRVDIFNGHADTFDRRHFIREKASTDAARLLSLTSHPPTRPTSLPPSSGPSPTSSRSPSVTLLNSASSNLPETLPTPPRQKHTDPAPPTSAHNRMKGFWESTRRLSNSLSNTNHNGYRDLKQNDVDRDEGVVLLNMDFKDTEPDSPASIKSIDEGFVSQDVLVGGTPTKPNSLPRERTTPRSAKDADNVSVSDSDDELVARMAGKGETAGSTPLVKA
ncbi:hypothetical protein BU24DRAFT_477099 [Aaosphaeria arxii CBS 175.79]|uniref:Uncharacterized protein n=1 Tax=Aaosphaeria arxii CBS 175.79 TaxID=1450172 RepID=A0A6A5Y5G3_9PLEO|nr:uncharacterized protein BU24DRAFT_477099 [Aaosphaeria arxii CBS 175.79]KAF2020020.1 hypothetical protein BU24DRAFT_477099 [Aaosphaeria arxii CBS 175.79]